MPGLGAEDAKTREMQNFRLRNREQENTNGKHNTSKRSTFLQLRHVAPPIDYCILL